MITLRNTFIPMNGTSQWNSGTWASRGLKHLWFFDMNRDFAKDMVSGVVLAPSGQSTKITPYGLEFNGLVNSSFWIATLPTSFAPPVTILTGFRLTGGVVPWALGVQTATWTGYYGETGNKITSTNAADFSGTITPSSSRRDDIHGFQYSVYAMSGANDLRGSTGGGAVVSDTSCAAPSGTINRVQIGRSPANDNWGNGYFRLLAIWDRAFSNHELQALSGNPWQLFVPARRGIRFGTSAAAPSGFKGAWAATRSRVIGVGVH